MKIKNRIRKPMTFTLSKEVEETLRRLSAKTKIKMSSLVEIGIESIKKEYE